MSSEHRRRWGRWALAALVAGAALGCADFSRGPTQTSTDETTDGGGTGDGSGSLSFATDVYPLLTICANCHVPGGAASATSLLFAGNVAADYTTILKFVDTSAPEGSRMLSKMSGNGHGGGTIYAAGTSEYETVLHWIQQGAPQ
jgi:hypothetical protein